MSGGQGSRLPTRCPACKGVVTQRMAGRPHGAFIWYQCFFCNFSWRVRLDDARLNPGGELTGDVFIVREGKRQPLGSVELYAIPEHAVHEFLERKTLQRARESEGLQRKIDVLTATLEEVRAEEARLWTIQKADEGDLQKARAWSAVYNRTKDLGKELEELDAQRQRLASGAPLFGDIPSPIATAQTDEDGKFTLLMPRDGRYGILARGARELAETKETYVWFVWVSLDGEASKHLVLNSDNIVGAGAPDSAVG